MLETERNKQTIQDSIQIVWRNRTLTALGDFWTDDCINHAMPTANNCGLDALHAYHEQFLTDFAAFDNVQIEILQQIAEGDRVVTYLVTHGEHIKPFMGIAPTHKSFSLATIRIDRLQNGKIAEHWSVADLAGLLQQLQN